MVSGLATSQEDREIHRKELDISDIINQEDNYYTWLCLNIQAAKKTTSESEFSQIVPVPNTHVHPFCWVYRYTPFQTQPPNITQSVASNLCTHQQTLHAAPLLDEIGVSD